jgi:hypothetical protein
MRAKVSGHGAIYSRVPVRWSFVLGMSATEVRNIYLEFLDQLNAVDVRYAVLHGWETLVRGEVSDIDIIVAKEDLSKLEAALCERYRVLNLIHYEASSFAFVLSPKDQKPASLFIADLSSDYRCRGRIFLTAEELLSGRRRWREFWVIGPAQEFEYLLVKKIYEKSVLPEHQRIRLERLAEELQARANSVSSKLFGTMWGDRLIRWIIQRRWDQIIVNIAQLQRQLRWRVLYHDHLNSVRYWFAEARRVWLRTRYPTGLSVLVLGPDGPDKRKVIKDLTEALANAFRQSATLKRFPVFTGRNAIQSYKSKLPEGMQASKQQPTWFESCLELQANAFLFLFKLRPLLIRSTLLMFEQCCDELPATCFAGRLIPRPNLSFVVSAHDHSTPEIIARDARNVIAEYLQKRYVERRHIWFHCDVSETVH